MTPRATQPPLFVPSEITSFGIDPGSKRCGWGVVRREGRSLRHVASGEIRPSAKRVLEYRLAFVVEELSRLLAEHDPDVVGLEGQYVMPGRPQAALVISQARGAAAVAVGMVELRTGHALPLVSLQPNAVKAAVCHGKADKAQVRRAVQSLLGLAGKMGEDESDALAIAIATSMRWRG